MQEVTWAYGLTTVKSRFNDLLPRTLSSLAKAGFENPHIFVDGPEGLALPYTITNRCSRIRTYGNWVLGLAEIYIRNPTAMLYAMFQDDFTACRNLKAYLSKTCTSKDDCQVLRGTPMLYWNLFTFPSRPPLGNQHLCPKDGNGRYVDGWYKSNQHGHGAVALIFSRQGVIDLLCHNHIVARPQDVHWGHKKLDGGICQAYRYANYTELVHYPSLVQHIGDKSSMENAPHPRAEEYRGEDFDALSLLPAVEKCSETK